jgi:hypothetical protein
MKWNEIFCAIHPNEEIGFFPGVVRHLQGVIGSNYNDAPSDVVKFFCKMRVLLRVQYLNWMTENDKYQKQEARRLQFLKDNDRVQDDGMEENVEQELDELTVLENDLIEIEQLIESSQFFSVQ